MVNEVLLRSFSIESFRYSTGSDIISGANLIHEFYTHETRNPVYILVDTSLKNDSSFQIKAYIGYVNQLYQRKIIIFIL
jgi:hypothetical protein